MLDLLQRQPRFFSDCLERHRPIVRAPFEYRLNERHQADLLTQEGVILVENWLLKIPVKLRNCVRVGLLTSFGNSGARASNLPMFPSLKVKSSFLIQSNSDWSRSSSIGCINYEQSGNCAYTQIEPDSYQLAEVVYLVTEESSNAEVMRPAQPVFGRKILSDIHAGEIK